MNIAFVPVRCGSQSIEWKNIKSFCGMPLLYWCLRALQDCPKIDQVYVATDCDKISNIVNHLHLSKVQTYRREAENATSTASTEAVMLEFLNKNSFSSDHKFILVQATNPFVLASDFYNALKKMETEQFDSLLTCCRIKRFFWNQDGTPKNYDYKNRPRRQDFKGDLVENGAFYINSVGNILADNNRLSGKIGIYEMPEYSFTEIDEPEDWAIAEQVFRKNLITLPSKKRIKLLLSDVDGVLTDAGMYYTESGDEIKKFNTYDGIAFSILKSNGIKTGIITSEDRKLNQNRANKLKLDFIYQGVKNKLEILRGICQKEEISTDDVAYVGDDINDLEILRNVGLAACPSTATNRIKEIEGIVVLDKKGGEGVIRELLEKYIEL